MLLLHKFTVIDFESISKGSQNSFTFMISYKSCSYVKFILDVSTCVAQRQKLLYLLSLIVIYKACALLSLFTPLLNCKIIEYGTDGISIVYPFLFHFTMQFYNSIGHLKWYPSALWSKPQN